MQNNHDINTFVFVGVFRITGYKPTPATVQMYTALLGDLCSSNFDCTIENSVCASGACNCDIHFTETSDRQQCICESSQSNYLENLQF